MQYNPQNQQGILGLVAALREGMDPSTAYSLFQGIQSDQASRIAARQQRLGGLSELITNAAAGGMPYEGTQALAEAQPGPFGPAAQSMLNTLYPQGELPSGAGMMSSGSFPAPAPRQPVAGPRPEVSPIYQPDPMAQLQMQEQMMQTQQAVSEADIQAAWSDLVADAQKYRAAGKTMDEFIQLAAQGYPELVGTDPEQFQQVVATIFHEGA